MTPNAAQAEALSSCPFCRGEAAQATVRYSDAMRRDGTQQTVWHYVNCIRCGACNRGIIGHPTPEAAAMHWNHRTPPAMGAEVSEAEVERACVAYYDNAPLPLKLPANSLMHEVNKPKLEALMRAILTAARAGGAV